MMVAIADLRGPRVPPFKFESRPNKAMCGIAASHTVHGYGLGSSLQGTLGLFFEGGAGVVSCLASVFGVALFSACAPAGTLKSLPV